MDELKGKERCPTCGSTNIIFNNISDYYRCNKCKRIFFAPSYGPGQDIKATPELTRQIFGEAQAPEEEPRRSAPEKSEPDIIEPRARESRAREPREYERRPRPVNLGCIITLVTFFVLMLIVLVAWILYGEQIKEFIIRLLE
ncbi:hypothetical protein ACFLW0_01050 [Chloroflexota bacterium]